MSSPTSKKSNDGGGGDNSDDAESGDNEINKSSNSDDEDDSGDKPMVNSIEMAAFEAAMEDGVKLTPSNKNLPAGFHTKKTYNIKPPSSLRRGKWTQEEEDFANKIIHDFKHGKLPLAEGTTLRTFLSKVLNCDPMRISKKFVGKNCVGKQVFRGSHSVAVENFDYDNSELAELEKKFFSKLSQKSNSSSKSSTHYASNTTNFHGGAQKNSSYSQNVRTPVNNSDKYNKESKHSLDAMNGLVYPTSKLPGLGGINPGLNTLPYIAGNANDFLLSNIVNSPVNLVNIYGGGHHITGALNNSLYSHNYHDYLYPGSNINIIKPDHSLIPSMSNRSLSSSLNNSESDFTAMNKFGSNSIANSRTEWNGGGGGGGMKNLYSAITNELASMESTATDDNLSGTASQDISPRFSTALSALQSLSSAALHGPEHKKSDSSDEILGLKGKRDRKDKDNTGNTDDLDNDVGYSYDEIPESQLASKKEFNSSESDLGFPPAQRSSSVSDFLYMVNGVNSENNSQSPHLSGDNSPDSNKLKKKRLSDDN